MANHQVHHHHPASGAGGADLPGAAGSHAPHADAVDLAELLDLDAEVLGSYLSDVTAWVHQLAADLPCHRILDIGSGTGTGTVALARQFASAEVIALDQSAELLGRLEAKAAAAGLAGRVQARQADLDDAWPSVGAVDVAWASMSLHHLAGPDRGLAEAFRMIRPGGYLAVAEMSAPLRFLPDDIGLGRPGLEARCQAVLDRQMAETVPELGSDWGERLQRAGFSIVAERPFAIELTPPLPAAAGRYAQVYLQRIRSGLEDQLDVRDLAALDTLISSEGPDGVRRRADLVVRTRRTAWMAQRL